MLLERPIECRGCVLDDKPGGFSRVEGRGTIPLAIVGESLGEHEKRAGLPFRPEAPAGSVLERVFKMAKFDREQFTIWNTIQCQPPRNWLEGAPWETAAISHCQVHRERIYRQTKPRAILALGSVALRTLTGQAGKSRGITMLRGYPLESQDWGVPVIGGYHPSYLREGKIKLINVLVRDLKHAVNIALGKFHSYCLNPEDDHYKFVRYQVKPTLDEARAYRDFLATNLNLLVNFDIETDIEHGVEEDVDEDIDIALQMPITQVQFSTQIGHAICMPWEGPYIGIIRDILRMEHVKAGHNAWRFDLPRLRREGVFINGVVHDTRWMWHHMQPDLPAHLQFVASFYGMPFAWKHIANYNNEFYGCADADALSRIMDKLPSQMQKRGVWNSYERQLLGLDTYLVRMGDRGVPVDNDERDNLRVAITDNRDRVKAQLQDMVPTELKPVHPPEGYKKPPKDTSDLVLREFPELVVEKQAGMFTVGNEPQMVTRWCRIEDFNPNSTYHVQDYIRWMAEHHPKKSVRAKYKVPKKWREDKETTEEVELWKLVRATKDEVLPLVIEVRGFQKMLTTYVEGWAPAEDGFTRGTFEYNTAVGQLNSKNPNLQNFPIREALAKQMRAMIAAKPGHKLIEVDLKSAHAVTLGFEANSPNWVRLARADIHSFTAAHFLKLPGRDYLLEMPDDELNEYLARVKEQHTVIRDNKAKHAILGVGNGLGYRGLYRRYSEFFTNEAECKLLHDTIKGVFPEVFRYQNARRLEAHQNPFMLTLWGYIRWFFDVLHYDPRLRDMVPGNDSEAAVAFHHPNDAFGYMKEQMLWLGTTGRDERYQWCNTIHDSLFFHCPDELVEECAHTVHHQVTLRSPVLKNALMPEGLYLDADVKVGCNWRDMEKIKMPPAAGLTPGEAGLATLVDAPYVVIPVIEKEIAESHHRIRAGNAGPLYDDVEIPF